MPENKIKERRQRGLRLFTSLFPICNELYVFDNSAGRDNADSCLLLKMIDGKAEIDTYN